MMAEMFQTGDKDKNEKLELQEFVKGMLEHPVTSKILRIKKIGKALINTILKGKAHEIHRSDDDFTGLNLKFRSFSTFCRFLYPMRVMELLSADSYIPCGLWSYSPQILIYHAGYGATLRRS